MVVVEVGAGNGVVRVGRSGSGSGGSGGGGDGDGGQTEKSPGVFALHLRHLSQVKTRGGGV